MREQSSTESEINENSETELLAGMNDLIDKLKEAVFKPASPTASLKKTLSSRSSDVIKRVLIQSPNITISKWKES